MSGQALLVQGRERDILSGEDLAPGNAALLRGPSRRCGDQLGFLSHAHGEDHRNLGGTGPRGFAFAFKAPQVITHLKHLPLWGRRPTASSWPSLSWLASWVRSFEFSREKEPSRSGGFPYPHYRKCAPCLRHPQPGLARCRSGGAASLKGMQPVPGVTDENLVNGIIVGVPASAPPRLYGGRSGTVAGKDPVAARGEGFHLFQARG